MTEVAAQRGYGGASVARVIEAAGTSRATFYEHFADREDCFLAAHRLATARLWNGVRRAADAADSESSRVRPVLEALLGGLAADPAAARLVLIEALAAPERMRAEHGRLTLAAEHALEKLLDREQVGAGHLQIPPSVLLGGIVGILSKQALNGGVAACPSLSVELIAWAGTYALPVGERRLTGAEWGELSRDFGYLTGPDGDGGPPALLPRGRSALPAGPAEGVRRRRILDATSRVTASRGYRGLTVAEIASVARVSRGAFYTNFRGKQDAFLAALAAFIQDGIGVAASAFFAERSWPDRVWSAGAALLGFMERHRDHSYLAVVEACAAGEAAIRRQEDARAAFTLFLGDGFGGQRDSVLPRLAVDAIAGGVFSLVQRQLVGEPPGGLLEVLPQAAYVALAPLIGPREALEFVTAKGRAAAPAL